MENTEYEVLYSVEDQYWWYLGLFDLVLRTLSEIKPKEGSGKLLDAGCGTGGVLIRCKDIDSEGFDFSEEAIRYCQKRGLENVRVASIADIPFDNGIFDIALSLDVICNVKSQDEEKSFEELHRVLKSGGRLVLNLPAYKSLKSKHDWAVHIQHRYRRKELKEKLEKAGFIVEKISYRNTVLFPFLALKRVFEKMILKEGEIKPSDLTTPLPGFINQALLGVILLENKLLKFMNFPYGLSIFCIATKQ